MDIREILSRITGAMDAAGIRYMLVGSFAAAYYGHFRNTGDIDFVIDADPEQLRKFNQELKNKDYSEIDDAFAAWRKRSMFNVLDRLAGWKIDFIFVKARAYSREEFLRRRQVVFEGASLFVASPEDVIISKLEWAKMGQSLRQVEDVAGLLRKRWGSLDHSYLGKWIAELGLTSQWEEAKQQSGIE